jgi:hypothetical protein
MARASRSPSKRSRIPESFEPVVATTVAKRKVPTIVLRGDWLKAAGFPIGTNAYLICDRDGELALHRVGLRVPRRLLVRAVPE